jgi:hypothetical protein
LYALFFPSLNDTVKYFFDLILPKSFAGIVTFKKRFCCDFAIGSTRVELIDALPGILSVKWILKKRNIAAEKRKMIKNAPHDPIQAGMLPITSDTSLDLSCNETPLPLNELLIVFCSMHILLTS